MKNTQAGLAPDRSVDAIIALIRSFGTEFFEAFEGQVKYGHLRGYKMLPVSSWSKTDLASKLFGLYEKEVIDAIFFDRHQFDTAVVLGAADGYYSVGLVSAGLVDRSICFETSPQGREIIQQTAALNRVADRVSVFGTATSDFIELTSLDNASLDRTIFIVDVEGEEFSLLSPEIIRRVQNAHLIVELHGGMVPGGKEQERRLLSHLAEHFNTEILTTGMRDLAAIPELTNFTDNLRWLVCSEGRPHRMRWIYCKPWHRSGAVEPGERSAERSHMQSPALMQEATLGLPTLLYLCAFGESYFKEAIVSIKSWRDIGGYAGQVILFCDKIRDVSSSLQIAIEDLDIEMIVVRDICGRQIEAKDAAAFRLRIFDYVPSRRIFIYCDTDIVCMARISLPELYANCNFSKVNLYGYSSRIQDAVTQAAFVTDDPKIIASKATSSGFIIFTDLARGDFSEILSRFSRQQTVNSCWEQPMFNYVLLKNGSAHIDLDQFFIEERDPARPFKSTAVFNHYCGLRGGERFEKMKQYVEFMIERSRTV